MSGLSSPTIGAYPLPVPWFRAPCVGFEGWARAGQRIWAWFKNPIHGDETRFRVTDRELAEILGVGRRCIQYGLWWLEQHGFINREWKYGARSVAGRVIEITINLAGKKPAAPGKAAAPAQSSAKAPGVPAGAPTAPDPVVPPAEPPQLTPEEEAAAEATWKKIRQDAAAARAAAEARGRPLTPEERKQQRVDDSREKEAQRERERVARFVAQVDRKLGELLSVPEDLRDALILAEIERLKQVKAQLESQARESAPARE